MLLQPPSLQKFNRQHDVEDQRFWRRMGHKPDLNGKTVLEIGCGRGSLSIHLALDGAIKVVGLDLKADLIDFANAYLARNYPQLLDVVEFKAMHLKNYALDAFDCIVSKDTFEHIVDMDCMLAEMKKRLKPKARIYTGFGPLYRSPYGDHSRRGVLLKPWGMKGRMLTYTPWAHLFMEKTLVRLNNQYRSEKIISMKDLGLSCMSLTDYREAFRRAGLKIVSFRTNQSERWVSKVFSLFNRLPVLDNYFTHSVYCILEKAQEEAV
jgi:SAM-dependent methyltransferase